MNWYRILKFPSATNSVEPFGSITYNWSECGWSLDSVPVSEITMWSALSKCTTDMANYPDWCPRQGPYVTSASIDGIASQVTYINNIHFCPSG